MADAYALIKNGFYTNLIVCTEDFAQALVDSGEIDLAELIEEGAPRPSPGDPVPVYYSPADETNWSTQPENMRDAVDTLANRPSFAADKGDVNDQEISGTDWAKVLANRLLWTSGFYDLDQSWFTIPLDGVYNHDLQLRLNNLVNVAAIEVSLFMRVDGVTDDYWFTLAKGYIQAGMTEIHLGNSTQFDFYAGEVYYMAVQLTPTDAQLPCSATILGSDDFTAWGSGWSSPLVNGYRAE